MKKFLQTYVPLHGECRFGNIRDLPDGSMVADVVSEVHGVVDTVVIWTVADVDVATSARCEKL
jgi:hypothetical protein